MGELVLKTKRAERKMRKKIKKERIKERLRSDVAGLDYMHQNKCGSVMSVCPMMESVRFRR